VTDLLREEFLQAIQERADLEFKGKLQQAFVGWYIEAEFGRAKWDFTDDAGDGGIDAIVWRPGERQPVVIIQSKFSERIGGSLLSEAAYKEFSRVVDAFHGDEDFDDFMSRVREDARRPYRRAQAALEDVGNWLAEKKAFRLITTSRKRARRLEDPRLPRAAYRYADEILELYGQFRKGHTPRANDLVLEAGKKLGYRDPDRRVTSYLFNARVSDFRRYFEQNDVARLVARNIRYNLGGKVGKEIRKTYEEHPHDFWYVHNGITIVCDDCREGRSKVTLENPSVVNGAQTLYAISGSSRKTSPAFMATRVVVRAARKGVAHEDDEWVQTIIRGVNTQNRVRTQDFRSNEPEQLELQNLFRDRKVFYERKRGEWREVRNDPRYKGFDRTSLRSVGIALTVLAHADGSGVVRVKRSVDDIFELKNYQRLFPARAKIKRRFEHIYLAYRVARFVGDSGYSSAQFRKQRHAFWTTVWLFHKGLTDLPRFHSRSTIDSICSAFDDFGDSGRSGRRARALVKRVRRVVWAAWRKARTVDRERWTANNFFKSTWGHKKVLAFAMPRVRHPLRDLGKELFR
jgi:AIPR protein